MTGRWAGSDERLHRPPLRLPRPHGAGALRWLVAAGLLGIAALLLAAEPQQVTAPPSTSVVVAARDLPGGVALTRSDLRSARLPRALVPRGALRVASAALGRATAGPVRAGEPITDVRLLGPALVRAVGGAATVAAPVRIADPGAVALLRPGDRVDVVSAGSTGSEPPRMVASNVPVVGVPPPDSDGAAEGALIVLATSPDVAARLVAAAATSRLSLTVRGR